jgi:hypothetical protein
LRLRPSLGGGRLAEGHLPLGDELGEVGRVVAQRRHALFVGSPLVAAGERGLERGVEGRFADQDRPGVGLAEDAENEASFA